MERRPFPADRGHHNSQRTAAPRSLTVARLRHLEFSERRSARLCYPCTARLDAGGGNASTVVARAVEAGDLAVIPATDARYGHLAQPEREYLSRFRNPFGDVLTPTAIVRRARSRALSAPDLFAFRNVIAVASVVRARAERCHKPWLKDGPRLLIYSTCIQYISGSTDGDYSWTRRLGSRALALPLKS